MIKNNQKIPEGWSVKKLGDIGKVSMCKRIMKHETNPNTGVPFYKIGTFGGKADAYISEALYIEYKNKYSYPKKGDILISAAGTIGRTVVFDGKDSYFQDSNIVWVANDEAKALNKYLLYYYTTSPWYTTTGGAISRLYNENISNAQILLPPLAEQEKIAGILGTWDEAIEKLSSLIEQKKLLKKGLMQRLLIGKTRLNGFTQPWKEVKLGDICKIATGKKDVNEGNPDGLYPFFTCAKINTFSDTFSFDQEAILIAGNGEVGHCQYYNGKFEAYQRTYILSDFTLSALLLFQYLNYFFKQRIDEQKQQGAMPYIKLKTLIDFQIYIPRDKNEQNSLLNILSTADDEINLLNKKLEALKEQKKGLMQQLLTGQTRVKVN